MEIEKPGVTGIARFLEENRGDVDDEQFVKRYVTGVIETLKTNKKLYRSFGGYWWPLKRIILALEPQAAEHLGEEYDSELNEAFSYGNDALTVCAAYLTQDVNIEQGYMDSNKHTYYTAENEPIELTIEDTEMEKRIFAESFV